MRDTMTTEDGSHPPAPGTYEPRPARWWLLRVLGLPLFTAAAAYAWWTPDIGPVRSTLSTLAALFLAGQLTAAWRRRRAHAGKTSG